MCNPQQPRDRGNYRADGDAIEFTWSDGTREQHSFRRTSNGVEIDSTKYFSALSTDGLTLAGTFTALQTMFGSPRQTEMVFTKSGEVSVNGSWSSQQDDLMNSAKKTVAGGSRTRRGRYRITEGTLEIRYEDGPPDAFTIIRLPNDPSVVLLDGYPYLVADHRR